MRVRPDTKDTTDLDVRAKTKQCMECAPWESKSEFFLRIRQHVAQVGSWVEQGWGGMALGATGYKGIHVISLKAFHGVGK